MTEKLDFQTLYVKYEAAVKLLEAAEDVCTATVHNDSRVCACCRAELVHWPDQWHETDCPWPVWLRLHDDLILEALPVPSRPGIPYRNTDVVKTTESPGGRIPIPPKHKCPNCVDGWVETDNGTIRCNSCAGTGAA